MKKKKPSLSRKEWLALKPWRNPALTWFEEEGRVVLHIKRRQTWKTKVLNLFLPLPEERKIALDAIGTHVWRLMDGKNSVGAIARSVAREYKLVEREAELSVQQFFRELAQRGYAGFTTDKTAEKPSETKAKTEKPNNDKAEAAAPLAEKTLSEKTLSEKSVRQATRPGTQGKKAKKRK